MSRRKTYDNGWNEYEKLVMSKLDTHDKNFSDLIKQIQLHNDHLAEFKLDVAKALENHKASCKIVEEFPKFSRDIAGIKTSIENIRKTEKAIENHTSEIGTLKTSVAQLQVKSGLWGALGGLVSLIVIIITATVKSGFSSFLVLLAGK